MPSITFWRSAAETPTTFYAELIRRGLPADYARRTADEVEDHRADVLAEAPGSDVAGRIGDTRQLARRIASDFRRRSWFGRWPLISFLLAPAPLMVLGWVGVFTGVGLVGELFELVYKRPSGPMSATEVALSHVLATALAILLFYVVPVFVSWACGRLALRTTQNRAYLITACAVIGIANGLVYHDWEIRPEADTTHGRFSVGVPLSQPIDLLRHYAEPEAVSRLAAPLLVGGVLFWREGRRRGRLLAPSSGPAMRVAA